MVGSMMITEEDPGLDVGLHLALGLGGGGGGIPSSNGRGSSGRVSKKRPLQQPTPGQFHVLFPSHPEKERAEDDDQACVLRDWHVGGMVSGLSLSTPAAGTEEEDSIDKDTRSADSGSARKKLRLSKEQLALLEESFRQHSTLNTAQKQELAHRLNLRLRQVEVWFQNRRARTKLKQTEADCEFLKKWLETLTDENRRFKRELQELRSMRTGNIPFFL